MKEPKFVNSNTFASNPGQISVSPFVWYRHHAVMGGIIVLLLLAILCLCLFVDMKFVVLFIIFAIVHQINFIRIKEHFYYGDSNGGIVLATNPVLVAVYTNLSKGFGYYPVIKIIECPTLKALNIGDRIATVALYQASINEQLPHWINFEPLPVNYVSNNQADIDKALLSYGEDYWERLEQGIPQVPQPYQVGLYKINIENSDWEDDSAELVQS
ncbi:DUF3239 domain-containing protein [Psychrobacter sp. I-STPA6b]|uniref:DUF3239 domain-containing protein n=1 Tax=Psychrobacter sp. I-STPA6b TaxID=2585718 RepID=UPI001D0C7E76|nr:DUF3239 domain-containing protein [Psychrobacter sp. I-STPA6b]